MKNIQLFIFLTLSWSSFSQDSTIWVTFHSSPKQVMGFDSPVKSSENKFYPTFSLENGQSWKSSYKILAYGKSDFVEAHFHGDPAFDYSTIEFYFGNEKLNPEFIGFQTVLLNVKNPKESFDLLAYSNGKLVGQLKTMVYPAITKKVILVPLVSQKLDSSVIRSKLVSVYKQANFNIKLEITPPFHSTVFDKTTIFSTPENYSARYSGQMRLLRDQYFKENPNADKKAFYLFIIPGFSSGDSQGYMIADKALGFVPYQNNSSKLGIQIARTLSIGVGGLSDSWIRDEDLLTSNLMDTTYGSKLKHFQITELHREMDYFSRFDSYEYVKTGNGTIAYYFWEEDGNGNIIIDGKSPFNVLRQPFKKNFLAYKFDVQFAIMRPLFRFGKYYISILNFVFVFGIFFLVFYIRKRVKIFWVQKGWKTVWRRSLFWLSLGLAGVLINFSFGWGNDILDQFKKVSGPMPALKDLTYREARNRLFTDPEIRKQGEANLCSEILIKRNNVWEVKKRGHVLYFELRESDTSAIPQLKLVDTSDSLFLDQDSTRVFARTHYAVYTTKNSNGKNIQQVVYTFDGKKVDFASKNSDIPRRVLVFANGYRPTSVGQTLGEGFKGIQEKGLEFPNSINYIYDFDRYDYWQPWGEINLQFQNRINPSLTYYADGHFSISSSDYKSLLNFTRISQLYPLRCENPKKHTCKFVKNDNFLRFISPTSKTENLLHMRPNKAGFEYRKKKGKIAGMNLLQELNPYPNMSENDTLFIVAHSMGFAYAQGMIEVLRGKINFGGFYIIAPENAESGKVNSNEWEEIWQYGSRFNLPNSDAPCLQDGVAPQSSVKGLPYAFRVFIPESQYIRKGYFDSHFIGYYDWILKLQPKEKGFMKQR